MMIIMIIIIIIIIIINHNNEDLDDKPSAIIMTLTLVINKGAGQFYLSFDTR